MGEEPTRDRTPEACWSCCDRPTCPWPHPLGLGNDLRQLGSCTECSYRCCGEDTDETQSDFCGTFHG